MEAVLNPSLFFTQQFRYKSRVYRQPNVDEKQIAKLHTKVRDCFYLFPLTTYANVPINTTSTGNVYSILAVRQTGRIIS